jgi:membrane glycosyltransferase
LFFLPSFPVWLARPCLLSLSFFVLTLLLVFLASLFSVLTLTVVVERYKSINVESAAFKSKLSQLVGPMILLKAVGFEKDESDGKLKYNG